jgi:hypothetical protein
LTAAHCQAREYPQGFTSGCSCNLDSSSSNVSNCR